MKRREHVSCAHHETEFLVTTMIVLVTPAEMFSESEGCLKSLEFLIFLIIIYFLSCGGIGLLIIYLAQRF